MNDMIYQNDEINLIDYIKIIIKRKKIIAIIFIIFVSATTITSFVMPKTYEISSILNIPNIEIKNNLYLSNFIIKKIKTGTYKSQIRKELKLLSGNPFNFNIKTIHLNTKINMICDETQVNISKTILNKLLELIKKDYKNNVQFKLKGLEKLISNIDFQLKKIKFKKQKIDKQIINILNAEKNNNIEIEILEKKIQEIDALLEKVKGNNRTSTDIEKKLLKEKIDIGYIYSYIEAIAYAADLREKIANLKMDNENSKIKLESLKFMKDSELKNESQNNTYTRDELIKKTTDIKTIKIIQLPKCSEKPIKPNIKLNIAISSILGLMIGVFFSLFKDFYKKK